MFNDIEKSYRRGFQAKRFFNYYLRHAIPAVAVAIVAIYIFGIWDWLATIIIAVLLILYIIWFFMRDIKITMGKQVHSKGMIKILVEYFEADRRIRMGNLLVDLRKHNIRSKDDLQLAIQYFEQQIPSKSRPGLLEWTLSVIIALAPVIVLAYDNTTGTINSAEVFAILRPTVEIALAVIMPILLIKIVMSFVSSSHTKVENCLVDDLAYIYVNFKDFQQDLSKTSQEDS